MGAIAFPRNVNKTVYTLPSAGGGVGGGVHTVLCFIHISFMHTFQKGGSLAGSQFLVGLLGKSGITFFRRGGLQFLHKK